MDILQKFNPSVVDRKMAGTNGALRKALIVRRRGETNLGLCTSYSLGREDRKTAMNDSKTVSELAAALEADEASVRLKAALELGVHPEVELLDLLLERCAVEPDFQVREQLTWSLVRFPKDVVVPRLCAEVTSSNDQARSQALHTLSKIKDTKAWPVITEQLLRDPSDEVAQAAWRVAVSVVPRGEEVNLAKALGSQFGRGGREVQLSLSSALAALGEAAAETAIATGIASKDRNTRAHALATRKYLADPEAGFQYAVDQVKVLLAPRPKD